MQVDNSATIRTTSCLCTAKRLWPTIRSCYNTDHVQPHSNNHDPLTNFRVSVKLQPHSNNHDSDTYFRVHSFCTYVSTTRLSIILPYTPKCLSFGFCHQNPLCISLPCFDHPNSICRRIQSLTLIMQFLPGSLSFFTFSYSPHHWVPEQSVSKSSLF